MDEELGTRSKELGGQPGRFIMPKTLRGVYIYIYIYPCSLKENGDGMATSPFYLKGIGKATYPSSLKGHGDAIGS